MRRAAIVVGMAGGLVWGLALLAGGARWIDVAGLDVVRVLALAFLAPGLVMAAMVGHIARRRFLDDALIDGQAPAPGSALARDLRVLGNTAEQLVLALCLWPALALALPAGARGAVLALGLGLALSRVLFWVGYRAAPPLRAFGFAAGFYPTGLAGLWALWLIAV